MSRLVKVSGIIVAASQVRSKATRVSIQCRTCRHTVNNIELKPGLDGFTLPRSCGAYVFMDSFISFLFEFWNRSISVRKILEIKISSHYTSSNG